MLPTGGASAWEWGDSTGYPVTPLPRHAGLRSTRRWCRAAHGFRLMALIGLAAGRSTFFKRDALYIACGCVCLLATQVRVGGVRHGHGRGIALVGLQVPRDLTVLVVVLIYWRR